MWQGSIDRGALTGPGSQGPISGALTPLRRWRWGRLCAFLSRLSAHFGWSLHAARPVWAGPDGKAC
jgi:hypothetical protein